jgi:hypothetical protein
MSDRVILGIDPGKTGALAFYFTAEPFRVAVEDMPIVNDKVNAPLLSDILWKYGPTYAVIEAVGARPGQGVSSMFNFGVSYGIAIGVLGTRAVPLHFVTPAKWKKHFGLSSDKEQSRAKAIQLFPACSSSFARKKDDGRAEAALIAKYGAETLFPWSAAA